MAASNYNRTSESEIAREFEKLFSPDFELWKEVWLRHPTANKRLRIDYVGRCRRDGWQGLIGFELKRPDNGDDQFRSFMKALRQAIDYSECILETDLEGADNLFYKRLRYVFLYPSPFNFYHAGLSGEYGHDWGMGAIRLAGKFGVGVIQPDCGFHNTSCFLLSGEPAYWLGRGPTGMRHEINKRFGSAV